MVTEHEHEETGMPHLCMGHFYEDHECQPVEEENYPHG